MGAIGEVQDKYGIHGTYRNRRLADHRKQATSMCGRISGLMRGRCLVDAVPVTESFVSKTNQSRMPTPFFFAH